MKSYKTVLLTLCFCFASCDFGNYVSIFDIPYVPQIVIYGFVQVGEPWQIEIKKNFDVPNNLNSVNATPAALPEAVVKIYENGILLGNLTYNVATKRFTGLTNHAPQAGKTYRIKVNSTGFPTAEAETTIPFASKIGNWTTKPLNDKKGSDKAVRLGFEIEDVSPEKDYYQLSFESNSLQNGLFNGQGNSDLVIQDEVVIASLDLWDKLIQIQNRGNFICESCTFTDAFFKNAKHQFSFQIVPSTSSNLHLSKVQHLITIRQMNDDLYRFIISQQKQELTQGDPLSAPIAIQSNVKGGLGVFGAYYEQQYAFVVE